MKRFLAMLLFTVLSVFAIAGNGSAERASTTQSSSALSNYDSQVNPAVEKLKEEWRNIYAKTPFRAETSASSYLEIKNTRIVLIKSNTVELFQNVDYIVEFVLFSDYYGSAPYYSIAGIFDSVIVYHDGTSKVSEQNLFRTYFAQTFRNDFSDIISSVEDIGSAYNQIIDLGKI